MVAGLAALVAGSGASGAPPAKVPKIKAPAAIVIDAGTGRVLWAKREHMRRPIASTTKIMTALVAMEHLRPNEIVLVTRKASRVPYGEGLKAGERVPVWKLYYGLLLASANDTAVALAEAAGGTRERFLKLMNKKARALGLRHTQYRSASGLIDEGNYSTVRDLAMLTRYALGVPRFREIVATKHKRVWWNPPTRAKLYENHNKLLWRYRGRRRREDRLDARRRALPRRIGDAERHPADHRRARLTRPLPRHDPPARLRLSPRRG